MIYAVNSSLFVIKVLSNGERTSTVTSSFLTVIPSDSEWEKSQVTKKGKRMVFHDTKNIAKKNISRKKGGI